MKRIGILGAGTWGTALANLLASSGHEVMLWSRFPEEVNTMNSFSASSPVLPAKSPGAHVALLMYKSQMFL